MNDNEIVKALECCKKGDCKNCTFDECTTGLLDEGIALDLINRQKAEIERLNAGIEILADESDARDIDEYNMVCRVRADAIKEFAECVKKHQVMLFNEIYSVKGFADAIDNLVKEMVGDNND